MCQISQLPLTQLSSSTAYKALQLALTASFSQKTKRGLKMNKDKDTTSLADSTTKQYFKELIERDIIAIKENKGLLPSERTFLIQSREHILNNLD